jgi:hypothetical protein
MNIKVFIAGFVSVLMAILLGFIVCELFKQYSRCPVLLNVMVIILTLLLLVAGLYLMISSRSALSKRGKIIFEYNFVGWCVFILALIAIPNFIKARTTSSGNPCINNLRQIDAAANQFALENHLTNGAPINFPDDLTPYIKLNSAGKIPPCPAGGIYSIKYVGENPTCTFSTLTPAHALQ